MTLGEGSLVGPYRLERLLGRGGMAVVYEATNESIGRTVALKLISPDLTAPDLLDRFRQEGRMQATLDHPHVVTIYEAGSSEYGPYIAMRLVEGTTLAGLIDAGSLTSARTLRLIEQIASALDAAHAAGLIHRDIKPRNVLVDADDNAYLADFGLTRSGETEGATATGQFMATIAYVAPEVVSGKTAGPAADRYALAAVLFECLTGTTVFPRPTQAAVLFAHTHEPPPRVSGRREGIPAALDEVLIAGLAKDPAARPSRAADLVTRARVALAGIELGPPAPRVLQAHDDETTDGQVTIPAPVATAPMPRRGRRGLTVALAAVAGGLIGAGAVLLLGGDDESGGGGTAAGPAPPRPALAAPPAGTQRLGSDLAQAGRTVDCTGGPVRPASPACTIFQDRLAAATLVVPRDGVVRRWGVRSAAGEFALTVMRRRDAGYFQLARSRNEFVNDAGPQFFATDIKVETGDRLGLVVLDGSGVGIRAVPEATTGSWAPPLAGAIRPQTAGAAGELLLRADVLPGAQRRLPERLVGPAAAGAPPGKTLAREPVKLTKGPRVELRLVLLDDGTGALDVLRNDRRTVRIGVPDLVAPIDPKPRLVVVAEPTLPLRVGVDVVFNRVGSDRLLHHYFSVTGPRVTFVD